MLRIFTSFKIHRPQPDLNPRTLDLEESTLPRGRIIIIKIIIIIIIINIIIIYVDTYHNFCIPVYEASTVIRVDYEVSMKYIENKTQFD